MDMTQQNTDAAKKVNLNRAGLKLAKNTTKVRYRSGLTQKTFAEITGLSRSTVSRIEQSHHNKTPYNPKLSTLVKLANAFEVSVDSVVTDNL
jgi:transcriptional regulator with XRE-family HTH domain